MKLLYLISVWANPKSRTPEKAIVVPNRYHKAILFAENFVSNSVLPQRKMEKWHPCYSSQKEPKP